MNKNKMNLEHAVNACIQNNANYFFRYAKRYSKRKDRIGPLRNENDELTNDIPEMCNIRNSIILYSHYPALKRLLKIHRTILLVIKSTAVKMKLYQIYY